jgi:hypothetical protein
MVGNSQTACKKTPTFADAERTLRRRNTLRRRGGHPGTRSSVERRTSALAFGEL